MCSAGTRTLPTHMVRAIFLLFLIKKKKKRSIDSFYFSFFSRGKRYRIIEEKWSQPFLQYLVYFLNNKKIACV